MEFFARQPNGKICRFSLIMDTVTHFNMTEEDFIEFYANRGRQIAQRIIDKSNFCDFEQVKREFSPSYHSRKKFFRILRKMGDNETQLEDINQFEEGEL